MSSEKRDVKDPQNRVKAEKTESIYEEVKPDANGIPADIEDAIVKDRAVPVEGIDKAVAGINRPSDDESSDDESSDDDRPSNEVNMPN